MFYGGGLIGLVLLVLWIWSIFDVITTPNNAQRNLPKVAWVFIVVLLGALGALAWIVAGRPRGAPIGLAGRGAGWHPASDAKDDAAHLSERERRELERRAYYKQMDEELDRRIEEKRRQELGERGEADPDIA